MLVRRNTNTEVCPSAATFHEVTWLSTNSVVRTAPAVVGSATTAILVSKSEVLTLIMTGKNRVISEERERAGQREAGAGQREREREREREQ